MTQPRYLKTILAAVAMLAGLWTATPSVLRANEEEPCNVKYFGCCQYTYPDCGSPESVRCCLPRFNEAPCAPTPCGNYCNMKGPNCDFNPGG
jgi:hypothetical protein